MDLELDSYKDSEVTPREGDVVDQYDHLYKGRVIDIVNEYFITVVWEHPTEPRRPESEMIRQTLFVRRDERLHEGEPEGYIRDANRAWSQAINQDEHLTETKRHLNLLIDYKMAVAMRAVQQYQFKEMFGEYSDEALEAREVAIEALTERVDQLESELWKLIY